MAPVLFAKCLNLKHKRNVAEREGLYPSAAQSVAMLTFQALTRFTVSTTVSTICA